MVDYIESNNCIIVQLTTYIYKHLRLNHLIPSTNTTHNMNPHTRERQFLKDAGMTEDYITNYITQHIVGLRARKRTNPNTPTLINHHLLNPHQPKTLKTHHKAQTRPAPNNCKDFQAGYMKFRPNKTIKQLEKEEIGLKQLYELFAIIQQNKGLVEVLSLGQWQSLLKKLKSRQPLFKRLKNEKIYQVYMRFLIQYQFYLKGQTLQIKKNTDITKTLKKAVILRDKLQEVINSTSEGMELYQQEIVMFQRGLDELEVDYKEIDLFKMEQYCGEEEMDIRIQNPMDYGFNVSKLTNKGGRMTIKAYTSYQKNYHDQIYKKNTFAETLRNGKVFFGVNFQPSNLDIFRELWSKIDRTLIGFQQNFDLLSYLDEDIPGCSSPQFYMKVKGCWTGGHQQNIAMCAVNINHGPDASQWFSIPFEQVEQVRTILIQKFKVDLYDSEGLWFQKINWFIENGFSIKRIIQKKGDIVISGPGTLHWVRSFGVALQSAWNVMPKSYLQFKAAFHRYNQNYEIGFKKNGIIPFKALLIKYIEHEIQTIEEKTLCLILGGLEKWFQTQENYKMQLLKRQSITDVNSDQHYLSDLHSVCQICKHEILIYYITCWTGKGIACLECLLKNNYFQDQKLYYKYNLFHFQNFLHNARNRKYNNLKVLTLCRGLHIGEVKCSKRTTKMQEQVSKDKNETASLSNNKSSEIDRQLINANTSIVNQLMTLIQQLSSDNEVHTIEKMLKSRSIQLTESRFKEQSTNTAEVLTAQIEIQTQRLEQEEERREKVYITNYNNETREDNSRNKHYNNRNNYTYHHHNSNIQGHDHHNYKHSQNSNRNHSYSNHQSSHYKPHRTYNNKTNIQYHQRNKNWNAESRNYQNGDQEWNSERKNVQRSEESRRWSQSRNYEYNRKDNYGHTLDRRQRSRDRSVKITVQEVIDY